MGGSRNEPFIKVRWSLPHDSTLLLGGKEKTITKDSYSKHICNEFGSFDFRWTPSENLDMKATVDLFLFYKKSKKMFDVILKLIER